MITDAWFGLICFAEIASGLEWNKFRDAFLCAMVNENAEHPDL